MFKSSLATHSSIDHDLFPLLKVRSCVSEADESKNGPRFCAEDKMTGGAYEIRSRKLELVAEDGVGSPRDIVDSVEDAKDHRQLSPSNLQAIRRQQERIDALLSANSRCAVPPCVALPIDVYIQEQPSTGDTYVASVDAFSGLSLGDIIRSGWGVMEESVFLEILNAVEAFGYASASLPPHGNLSSDAIKQLLTVRDGASEARQPSRWVIGDWLLLRDDTVDSFDVQSFVADLEWVLHSSFAQLHISTPAHGGTLMSASRVEELVSETVERIRSYLFRQAPEAGGVPSTSEWMPLPDAELCPSTDTDQLHKRREAHAQSPRAKENTAEVEEVGDGSASRETDIRNGPPRGLPVRSHREPDEQPDATGQTRRSTLRGTSGDGLAAGPVGGRRHSQSSSSSSSEARSSPHYQDRRGGLPRQRELTGPQVATQSMTLKDKMVYHQAALRHEQVLVNRHRLKHALLPPRPQPTVAQQKSMRSALSPRALEEEEEEEPFYSASSLTSPIHVKPSAYLTQGRRQTGSSRTPANLRRTQSPRSGRTVSGGVRTPRDPSPATPRQSQPKSRQPPLLQPTASNEQIRERLLNDVVSMAVLTQRRRAELHCQQEEAARRRREDRQRALYYSNSARGSVSGGVRGLRAIPALFEQPRIVLSCPGTLTSPNAAHSTSPTRGGSRVVGGCGSSAMVANRVVEPALESGILGCSLSTRGDGGDGSTPHHPAAGARGISMASASPEPIPPSPHSYRVIHATLGMAPALPKKKRKGRRSAEDRTPRRGGATGGGAVASGGVQLRGKTGSRGVGSSTAKAAFAATPRPPFLSSFGVRGGTAAASSHRANGMNDTHSARCPASGTHPRSGRDWAATAAAAPEATGPSARAQRHTPYVKPLPLADLLNANAAAQKSTADLGKARTFRAVGNHSDRRPVPASSPAFQTRFRSPRFVKALSPNDEGGDIPYGTRWASTVASRPPKRQETESRSFRRVRSTGYIPSPRPGRLPLRGQPKEATAVPSRELAGEVSRRLPHQRSSSREAGEVRENANTQPLIPRAADEFNEGATLSPSPRGQMQSITPQVLRSAWTNQEARTENRSKRAAALASSKKFIDTPRPVIPFANGVRRPNGISPSPTLPPNVRGTNKDTAPNRDPIQTATPRTGRPAVLQKGVPREGRATCRFSYTGSLTLGSVRPVNEASPGILLRSHRSTLH